jgi:hypothetical protein
MSYGKLSVTAILILMAPVVLIYQFSASPAYTYNTADKALLIVSFKKITNRAKECDKEELKAYNKSGEKRRKHMQRTKQTCGSRERVAMNVEVWIDGAQASTKRHFPSGYRMDGYAYVYQRFKLKRGAHKIKVTAREQKEGGGSSYVFDETIEFKSRQVKVIDFDKVNDRFFSH